MDLKGAKVRVTMMVDLDLVKRYKVLAEKTGAKYQTLMNHKLREALEKEDKQVSVFERLEKLETVVFKIASGR